MEQIDNKRIGIDSMILIDIIEGAKNAMKIKNIFKKCKRVTASYLAYLETSVGFIKENRKDVIDIIDEFPLIIPNFYFIPMEKAVARKAGEMRAKYAIKTPDSIHIATAITEYMDFFISEDKQLKKIREIKIISLNDIKI